MGNINEIENRLKIDLLYLRDAKVILSKDIEEYKDDLKRMRDNTNVFKTEIKIFKEKNSK